MIKSRYVALVEIDFTVPENEPYLLPFDDLCNNWRNNTTKELTQIIQSEFRPYGNVKITQRYVDVYRCNEQEGE